MASRSNSRKCELRSDDIKIAKVRTFTYLGSILTDNEWKSKTHSNSERYLLKSQQGIKKKRKQTLVETKKNLLKSNLMSVILYNSESWRVTSQMKKNRTAKEM